MGLNRGQTAKTLGYAASLLIYTSYVTCHYLLSADLVACCGWVKVCQGDMKAIEDQSLAGYLITYMYTQGQHIPSNVVGDLENKLGGFDQQGGLDRRSSVAHQHKRF